MVYNIQSLKEIILELTQQQRKILHVPLVFQYNKRDLPNVLSVEELDKYLNLLHCPRFVAVAREGIGVLETLDALCARIIYSLKPPHKRQEDALHDKTSALFQINREPLLEDNDKSPHTPWIDQVRDVFIGTSE